MFYDGLKEIGRYRGLKDTLDTLIDWLAENDPAELPLGKTVIDGDKVFANTMESSTKPLEEGRFEFHHHYADVQVDLEGAERFCVTPGSIDITVPYDADSDKGYGLASEGNDDVLTGTLDHGRFVVYVPGEPHMCNIVIPGQEVGPLKKICFKVLWD